MEIPELLSELMEGEGKLAPAGLGRLLAASVDEISAAADECSETADYVIEKALEVAAENIDENINLHDRVLDYWLQLKHVPGGTIYEIAVRCAEILAVSYRKKNISEPALHELAESEDWRQRLIAAWIVREDDRPTAKALRVKFENDPFEDSDGVYLIREAAGHYDED